MPGARIAVFLLAALSPAIAFRLGGTSFWTLSAAGLTLAAALAAFALWQDEMLADVIVPKSLDVSWGVGGAALLYFGVVMAYFKFVAPNDQVGGLLRACGMNGPTVGRPDAQGVQAVLEAVRVQVCGGYARSLGVTGPLRGVLVVIIAVLEEIAWRGGVQQALSEKLGSTRGWLATTGLYAVSVAATGVWPLAVVGLLGGLLWGGLYRYRGRLAPAIMSHATFAFFLFHQQPLVVMR